MAVRYVEARRLRRGHRVRIDYADGTGKVVAVSAVEMHGRGICIIKTEGERWGYMISPTDEVAVVEDS